MKYLNSCEPFEDKVPLNLTENILQQKKFEDLFKNLENCELKLPSREFKNFLHDKWNDSIVNIREMVRKGNFATLEDAQLKFAALLFNMNINLSADDAEERVKLLDLFNCAVRAEK